MNFTDKHYNRLQKLNDKYLEHHNQKLDFFNESIITHKQRIERDDLILRQNLKQTHGIRLQGNNKYYLASQIAEFINWIEQNGTRYFAPSLIDSVHLVNNAHYGPRITIRFKDTYEETYKSFADVKSMFSFIEGHNSCKNNIK
jgi:hypothetical protein